MKLTEEELGIQGVEKSIARTKLYRSDEVFFSGTAMEVAQVVEVEEIKFADGKPGKVFLELKNFLQANTWQKSKIQGCQRPVYEK